jgi:glycosyltransferase involved in cell wall biosynthesis
MRILYAVHGYKPAVRIGGPAVSVPALAERLVRRGHDLTVVTSDRDLGERLDVPLEQEVDVEGVKVWYFPTTSVLSRWLPSARSPRAPSGFLYAPSMAKALQRIVPSVDLVHTHLPFIYPTYAAAKAARVARKPLVYHQRGVLNPRRLEFKRLKKRLYLELIERPILRQATLLLALTNDEAAGYRRLGAEQPCWTVPNGVDLPPEQLEVRARAQSAWALPQAAPTVVFLGRLHPLKGTRKLLSAFREVHRVLPDARLLMAGPDEEGELSVLRSLAAAFGLGDAVLFPGVLRGEQKALLLARADVFCLPSVAEGLSMAVLEAMAARTAVLLTPGCGFPEVAAAGAGRIVEDEAEGLQRALLDMLADPAKLARMGEAGRALVERDYCWDRIVDRLLEAYTESIGLHRASRVKQREGAR